ncbi:MAG TPA: capsule assembly Wzi family protein [Bacteroidales bacterium]|nr:capsule assembly Wzi family protein [Bacteroidales bacterium]
MKKLLLILLSFTGFCIQSAQPSTDTLSYSVNARITPGAGDNAPFLSTANQFDRHSFTPNSLSIWGNLHKETSPHKPFDYGFGMELNANASLTEQRIFPGELYVEGKVFPFLFVLGMKRDLYGNQDPELSSGGLIGSQNSRPIPSFTIETKGYEKVPFTKGYLEYWGGMANGYFSDHTVTTHTLLHHKWLHVRVGGSFPLTLDGGIQHVAQWAGSSPVYGTGVVNLDNFIRVFFGKGGRIDGPATEYYNALGNHIISKNLGLGLKLPDFSMHLYWQNIYEDGPIFTMNKAYNKEDGLWGISFRLPKFKPLHSFVTEFLSTTDQSGPWHDLDGVIYGGTDGYYNNGVYPNGWSFYGMTIGNPWLTSPKYNTDGGVGIQNNCVRLWYFSGLGEMNEFNYRITMAYSLNWGWVKPIRSTSMRQFSGQLEVFRPFPYLKNTEISLGLSGDRGKKYGNNFALLLGLRYSGQFLLNKKH